MTSLCAEKKLHVAGRLGVSTVEALIEQGPSGALSAALSNGSKLWEAVGSNGNAARVQAAIKKAGEDALSDPAVQTEILKVAQEKFPEVASAAKDKILEWANDPQVVFGLTMGTCGMQMIRMSELKKKEQKLGESRKLFILGMAMNILLGPLFDVAGYAFAAVINAVIAPFTLCEKLTNRRLIASAIIFITATASMLFKHHNEDEEVWTLERAETVLLRWSVLVYCLVFALWFCVNVWLRRRSAKGSVLRGFSLGATAGSMAGNMWCTRVAAVFAADCASAHVCSPWGRWLPWIVLTGAVFFAVVNAPYMAKGMQKYEALYMVTVFQGSNIVSNSLSALIILQEMDGAPWWKLLGYIGCIVVMIGALWFLVSGEEAVCPSNELDDDLRRMLSMEEGSELEDSESEDEPDLMDFVRAMSLDQFSPLSFSSWLSNAEDSQDGEGSREEQQQEESDND
ncbi:unnamed protein product [Cladocopium goreaui]|uniref:EamA domain-containing protein n=1 Tax=Cladocopium goreaui TaxID=2562237 RepID=A0A9P1DY53_9DINO|nr:unnamed protein product [Cladocopium goreaui]